MKNLINNQIKHLSFETNASIEDIKLVTKKEFEKTPFEQTNHNYYLFLDSLSIESVFGMLNILELSKQEEK